MNKEDIIRMAREAGEAEGMAEFVFHPVIERFAALVASAEREACAKVCDEFLPLGNKCAYAIRSRDKQDGECKHCTDGCPACDARKLPEQDCIEPDYKELWQQMCDRCDSLDKKLAQQDAILENQTARIVDLQTHIDNLEGEQ